MSNQPTTPAGITGNTNAQINASAAAIGSANRIQALTNNRPRILNLFIWAIIIVGGIILANAGIGFAYKLALGMTLIFGGNKMKKAHLPSLKGSNWPAIIHFLGWATLLLAIVQSGFGQSVFKWVNSQEAEWSGTKEDTDSRSLTDGGSECQQNEPLVIGDGTSVTVADCPLWFDQRDMAETGVDTMLTDPSLRAKGDRLGVLDRIQRPNSHVFALVPNPAKMRRYGVTSVEVVFYPKGTGKARVVEEYGPAESAKSSLAAKAQKAPQPFNFTSLK